MFNSFRFLALVVSTYLLLSFHAPSPSFVSAHSAPPRPLKRIAHPSTLSLEILPRRSGGTLSTNSKRSTAPTSRELLPTDSFRLTLSAFDDTFHLHLSPNEHLVHPEARISFFRPGPDGRSAKYDSRSLAEHIAATGIRAYQGEVVRAEHSARRMREDTAGVLRSLDGNAAQQGSRGWARILVHSTGNAAAGIAPSFEGAFAADGIVHHVATRDAYVRRKHPRDPVFASNADEIDSGLVVWRDSDVMSWDEELEDPADVGEPWLPKTASSQTCAHDTLPFNINPGTNDILRKRVSAKDDDDTPWYDPLGLLGTSSNTSVSRRDDVATGGSDMSNNFADSIGNTSGCPKEQKIVYTGVAADCTYTRKYGGVENATTQILNNWNTASDLFRRSFNVSLGIINLEMHDPSCPSTADPSFAWNIDCSNRVALDDRLSLFSAWRGRKGDDGAGLWHLMSDCPTGTEVGIAWLGTLCQQTSFESSGSTVSGTAVSTAGRTEWQVVAHETGHNFGAIHDCADGCKNGDMCCPLSAGQCSADSSFVMSPVAAEKETAFSQCSLGNVCSLMSGSNNGGGGFTNQTCLFNPAESRQKVISLSQCGNGIVEEGEDCDPGPNGSAACCNKATCKFAAGAVCDPASSPCCTGQCQFAPATTVCRPSKDSACDTQETCTGNSSACPADQFKPNGESCGSDGLACASGICTSLNKQCQQVGSSLNLKETCPQRDKSCRVSCQDPTTSNQCITLQSSLVDGSPCGYGGTCNDGKCQDGPFLDMAKSWYLSNKHISIPVTVVAGLLALAFLWAILKAIGRCCGGGRAKAAPPMQARYQGVPLVVSTSGGPLGGAPPPYVHQRQPSLGNPASRSSQQPAMQQAPYDPSAPAHFAYQRESHPEGRWESFNRLSGTPPQAPANNNGRWSGH